jgi:hypothetical protein
MTIVSPFIAAQAGIRVFLAKLGPVAAGRTDDSSCPHRFISCLANDTLHCHINGADERPLASIRASAGRVHEVTEDFAPPPPSILN